MFLQILGGIVVALSVLNMGLEIAVAKKEGRKINKKSIIFDLACIGIVLI